MRNILLFFFLLSFNFLSAQSSFVGLWKNLDDEDGKEKSHIEIKEVNGKLKATVVKLLPNAKLRVCKECKGENKDKPIEGMEIVSGLSKVSDKEYSNGTILNPKNGKVYNCTMTLESNDVLKVRGYMGISLIGKTQYWYRVK